MRIAPKYSPESQLCRVLMTLRGLDENDLARLAECQVGSIRNLLADSRPYTALSQKVEKILAFKIWTQAGTETQTPPAKIMNSETVTLPENLEPYREQIVSLHAAKTKLAAQLQENEAKHSLAIQERDQLAQSDPSEESNIPKLAEAQVKVQLFENHGVKLRAAHTEIVNHAARVTGAFSRELQKIAVQVESEARNQFLLQVAKLVVNPPAEIGAALNGVVFTAPLRSREEELARVLKLTGDYKATDGDPFVAFDELVDAWQEFTEAFNALQAAKREPITA
jgi:DNA repair exonuclease SbcCD ATPase subunit